MYKRQPWDDVHEEAERLEHAMSPVLEARMLAAIGDAKTCPHGHPIEAGKRIQGVPLADCEPGASVRILRFENEAEDLLHYLHDSGIEPGLDGTFVRSSEDAVTVELEGTLESSGEDEIVIASEGGTHRVSRSVAETVSVAADPAPEPRPPLPEQLELSTDRYGR